MGISKDNRHLLRELYETDYMKALKWLIDTERINLAKRSLGAPNMEILKYTQGQADALKQLYRHIRDINKEEREAEASSSKKS